ncbi:hypothetical protein BpHYR1_043373 [Brachionus plicatilis]|uniref:Uncharacterized protein n=1 Tax=Brachionus plicatilis TaxID=10195 RepID=A0A3M7RHL2_BRAPC|nr:hypothetical protein BpHYR1_043373 [Brachionus plicatilis]
MDICLNMLTLNGLGKNELFLLVVVVEWGRLSGLYSLMYWCVAVKCSWTMAELNSWISVMFRLWSSSSKRLYLRLSFRARFSSI